MSFSIALLTRTTCQPHIHDMHEFTLLAKTFINVYKARALQEAKKNTLCSQLIKL